MAGVESASELPPELGPETGAADELSSVDWVGGFSAMGGAKLRHESVDLLPYGLLFARFRLNCASVGDEDIL